MSHRKDLFVQHLVITSSRYVINTRNLYRNVSRDSARQIHQSTHSAGALQRLKGSRDLLDLVSAAAKRRPGTPVASRSARRAPSLARERLSKNHPTHPTFFFYYQFFLFNFFTRYAFLENAITRDMGTTTAWPPLAEGNGQA